MIYGSKIFNFCNDLYFRLSSPFTPISPISNCWQQNICGSLWHSDCAVGWPNATFASGTYQRLKYLAEAFCPSIWPKYLAKPKSFPSFVLVQTFRQKFVIQNRLFLLPIFQKLILMDINYFLTKTVLKQHVKLWPKI